MSSIATTDRPAEQAMRSKTIQPAWVRIVHWINAAAMVLMIMSGWQIYNASPLFSFLSFSHSITLGGWLGGALQWHFAAMWLLMVNGLVYLTLGLVTGRFRRKLLPEERHPRRLSFRLEKYPEPRGDQVGQAPLSWQRDRGWPSQDCRPRHIAP